MASQWQVKKDTLQKWLGKLPPQESEQKIQEGTGKKLFREDYVIKLITKFKPEKLEADQENLENGKPLASLYQEIIDSKNETIKILENQNQTLRQEMASQNTSHFQALENLNNQLSNLASLWQAAFLELENKKKSQFN